MAHPDPKRQGAERDQRRHVGPNTEKSDIGVQSKSQGIAGGKVSSPAPGLDGEKDDVRRAPESGEKDGAS